MYVLSLVGNPSSSIGEKARRIKENLSKEASIRFKKKQKISKNSILEGRLGSDDKATAWARQINLAMSEFEQKYPKYASILKNLIKKHKKCRRYFIEYGIKQGNELPEEFYPLAIEIIKDEFKISRTQAENIYKFSSYLEKKKGRTQYTTLIPAP
jgi:hypothetical protein